jgi:hypothetical protein
VLIAAVLPNDGVISSLAISTDKSNPIVFATAQDFESLSFPYYGYGWILGGPSYGMEDNNKVKCPPRGGPCKYPWYTSVTYIAGNPYWGEGSGRHGYQLIQTVQGGTITTFWSSQYQPAYAVVGLCTDGLNGLYAVTNNEAGHDTVWYWTNVTKRSIPTSDPITIATLPVCLPLNNSGYPRN